MYTPVAFNETDLSQLHDFIERHSFGVVVSQVDGLPFATHLPLLLDRSHGPNGTLVGHTARANPQCLKAGQQTVLAMFTGPHNYISPTWYESENVVPTWNYVAVHAYGPMELIEDKPTLSKIVNDLTEFYERKMPTPWTFDSTTTFADRLLEQIVGFRIEIQRLEGKFKLSQNQLAERQEKVIRVLEQRPDENSQKMARMMRERQLEGDHFAVSHIGDAPRNSWR